MLKELEMMLMRTDPFRELDRLTQQVFGTAARPAAMPMDAWQEDGEFVVAFDLPGVDVDSVDLSIEKNVLTVRAERRDPTQPNVELVVGERPRGVFSRQLILGETLETDKIKASYDAGVLTLRIPVAAQAKPRKIEIESKQGGMHEIST
jgi:HSP20 family protein